MRRLEAHRRAGAALGPRAAAERRAGARRAGALAVVRARQLQPLRAGERAFAAAAAPALLRLPRAERAAAGAPDRLHPRAHASTTATRPGSPSSTASRTASRCYFYRAWAQSQPAVGLDRPQRRRLPAPGRRAGRHRHRGAAGTRRDPRRRAAALRRAPRAPGAQRRGRRGGAASYFGVPVRLEPWVGHWMTLPPEELTRLGRGEASRTLGGGAMLGQRAWDRQHRVRLHLGPLDLERYRMFLPTGTARPALQRWMQQLLGDELVLGRAADPGEARGAAHAARARARQRAAAGLGHLARPAPIAHAMRADVRIDASRRSRRVRRRRQSMND